MNNFLKNSRKILTTSQNYSNVDQIVIYAQVNGDGSNFWCSDENIEFLYQSTGKYCLKLKETYDKLIVNITGQNNNYSSCNLLNYFYDVETKTINIFSRYISSTTNKLIDCNFDISIYACKFEKDA